MGDQSSAGSSSSSSDSSCTPSIHIAKPSYSFHSAAAMANHFATWQSRFHLQGQNVMHDSQIPGRFPHSSEYEARREEDEFNRLMNEDPSQKNLRYGYSQETFSSLPFESSDISSDSMNEVPFSVEQTASVPGEPSSKRRPPKAASKKAKKTKATVILSDDEEEDDSNAMHRWTDSEVSHLISFRSEMDQQFKANAKKQGINTWEKLQVRMVAACDNFAKSAEACRKKWKAVYNQYCTDKRLLQISGEGRKVSCRFFEEIDEGFNNAANVRKFIHGDADGSPNPCPPDLNQPGDTENSSARVNSFCTSSVYKDNSPTSEKGKGKTQGQNISGFLADMVDCSRNMVTQTTRIADDIHVNSQVLKDLQLNMLRVIDKL